ncbi:LLM class flavin-dependent oxidoreductase [Nocardia sp. 348MFTsu5.1]|uniref:LLM class flavin-dependent oxidoreductase n=1 Tax=Nocardia sp. 348MFTsu5.1 TaxID=1172185 RepID=UPI000372ED2D|nr:LLM class flavin-dependent oxidoreductase [Nocardia sp. 348MFTsu5.1]
MSGFVLGIEVDGDGYHPAAWRRAHHTQAQLLTGARSRTVVAAAENASFTFASFDDSPIGPADGPDIAGRIDAVNRAAFVAGTTSTIGLVPVISTTFAEPFHTSSQLATLDYASRGRAGWITARSPEPEAAAAFGVPVPSESKYAADQRDSVRVAQALWDSWDDDAVIRDHATGRFLDRTKLHYVDFEGENFSVKGPSIVPRPPQGRVVVFGRPGEVPADLIDVAIVSGTSPAEIRAAVEDARTAGAARVIVDVYVAIDLDTATAAQRIADLDAHTPHDLPAGSFGFSGTPTELVAALTSLADVADGARIHPLVLDEDLRTLTRSVLPPLIESGVVSRPLIGATLRDHLGLDRPANLLGAQ